LELQVDDCEDDDDDYVSRIRSRLKGDIWHDYHSLPMQKKCPAKSIALMLLIHETTEFVEKDLRPVQRYVQEELGVEDWRLHFRFNREWWRKRVRMLTPKAKDHASRIRVVHNLMKYNEELKDFYDENVEEYFVSLERKALEGYYEKLTDVSLFDQIGTDSKNLALWIRKRGSVQCELIHQKMFVSIGP
jgi:hypothetical protein